MVLPVFEVQGVKMKKERNNLVYLGLFSCFGHYECRAKAGQFIHMHIIVIMT